MKILVTGHKGYVGSVLVKILSAQKFEVIGCDTDYYPQNFGGEQKIDSLKKDIRDLTKEDLRDFSAICHLAGLSNDPLGEINSSLTHDINFLATVRLAKMAKECGVERFIFSSSCSTYGANSDIVDETSPLAPITAYAKSKVDAEKELIKLKDGKFCPVILRNATVYGISPSQRLDLVVNNLVGSAMATGKIRLLSDGTSWRPLLHVEDMANAFILSLKSPRNTVSGQIFNVGSNEDNYTVREVAEKVQKIVPQSDIEYAKEATKDTRSYKVRFDKIKKELGYKTKWKLEEGIKQIHEEFKRKKFTGTGFRDKTFYRVSYLKWLLEKDILDKNLRFK